MCTSVCISFPVSVGTSFTASVRNRSFRLSLTQSKKDHHISPNDKDTRVDQSVLGLAHAVYEMSSRTRKFLQRIYQSQAWNSTYFHQSPEFFGDTFNRVGFSLSA